MNEQLSRTITDVVRTAAERWPDVEAIVEGDTRITFAELAARVEQAARAFAKTGVQRGDRVAIWAPNVHEWVVAALGVHTAGGVLVPVNTRFKGTEAADIIGRSRARILVTVNGFLGNDLVAMLRGADVDTPDVEQIVVLRGDIPPGTCSWADFLSAGDGSAALPCVSPTDLSDILFTSGTTGRSKGVLSEHGTTVRLMAAWADNVGLTAGDRYLVVNPFFHSFGYKAGIVASLITGATIVPVAVFDVEAVLRLVAAERITMLPGPPTLYFTILNHPERDRFDLSSLRLAVTGAAAVPVELIKRMRDELTFRTIITAYGMTEAPTITACLPDDDPATIATTSGRAIDGVEVRVVDRDGTPLPPGAPGEILCRGYNVMRGYFDDPEATAAVIDNDGWLHTGDIGTIDDRGYVKITDRLKDMYIAGGFNVYPAEVENTLLGHAAVAQVAVVGVPDERLGEVGHAFVVPRRGADLDPGELTAWSRDRMANYKVPGAVHVVDSLPQNAGGKVLKFQLREQASLRHPDRSVGAECQHQQHQ